MAPAKRITQEKLSWNLFKLQASQNLPLIFICFFLFWLIYGLYKSALILLGLDSAIFLVESETTFYILMFLIELPFIYLFFVLSIFFLKKMFYPALKIKDYFSIGLKLFIVDLVFAIIMAFFAELYIIYDTVLTEIILFVVLLFCLFFVFSSYKTIMKGNILENLQKTFGQVTNPKGQALYIITLIISIICFAVFAALIYLGILSDLIYYLLFPFILFLTILMSYYSVN